MVHQPITKEKLCDALETVYQPILINLGWMLDNDELPDIKESHSDVSQPEAELWPMDH